MMGLLDWVAGGIKSDYIRSSYYQTSNWVYIYIDGFMYIINIDLLYFIEIFILIMVIRVYY